jgi:hypothetical protein
MMMAMTYALSTHSSTGGSLYQSWTFHSFRMETSLDQMENPLPKNYPVKPWSHKFEFMNVCPPWNSYERWPPVEAGGRSYRRTVFVPWLEYN